LASLRLLRISSGEVPSLLVGILGRFSEGGCETTAASARSSACKGVSGDKVFMVSESEFG
jgi:hypothetical protein